MKDIFTDGYDYRQREDGSWYAIDRRTGKEVDAEANPYPVGSIFYTPQQQEDYRKKQEQKIKHYFASKRNDQPYYFVSRGYEFGRLSPESLARLIYLNSYLNLGGNKLVRSQRASMKRKDLAAVLKVSPSTVTGFWKEVHPEYLYEDDDGLILSNKALFIRGKGIQNSSMKFFVNGIKAIYERTPNTQHRYLGYVFQLIPYINIEFNILCKNPFETELKYIEQLTVGEYCELIGYDKTHLNRLLRAYKQLRFTVDDHEERFVSLVYDGVDKNNARLFINPNVLYSGKSRERVEVLGSFCQE